jgi:Gpi18-like mannosyltransferase
LNIFAGVFTGGRKNNLIKVVMVFGGTYLLWHLRAKLPPVAVAYGFCSLALIISSGVLISVGRFAYAIVSLSLALGVLFANHPRWGYLTMGLFATLLVEFAIKFAWWHWVA